MKDAMQISDEIGKVLDSAREEAMAEGRPPLDYIRELIGGFAIIFCSEGYYHAVEGKEDDAVVDLLQLVEREIARLLIMRKLND